MNPEITGFSAENTDIVAPVSAANNALIFAPMDPTINKKKKKARRILFCLVAVFFVALLGYLLYKPDSSYQVLNFLGAHLSSEIFIYILGGFLAQMVDGALGMAYGLTATTFLLSFGIPPAAASASVHTSEIFTSGASGLMHLKLRNVNRKLFRILLIPGILGAVTGAYVLSALGEYNYIIKP